MQALYTDAGASSATLGMLPILAPNERLLWSGKPPTGIKLEAADRAAIAFGLLCGAGFVVVGWLMSSSSGLGFLEVVGIFLIVGLPFWLYLVGGRFVIDAIRRAHSSYGVTNSRVIIITNWPGRNTKFFNLLTLPQMELSVEGNGQGTIRFGPPPAWGWLLRSRGNVSWMDYSPKAPGFRSIPQAKEVYDLINQARAAALRPEAQ